MLEMTGFDPRSTEAYWQGKLTRKEVKTSLDLFLLGYNIMRLHYSSVRPSPEGGQILTLGQDKEIDITYQDFPKQQADYVTYTAHRGHLSEALQLPRNTTLGAIEEPSLIIRGYASVWFQRALSEDSDDQPIALPMLDDLDVLNTALTAWRARKYVWL